MGTLGNQVSFSALRKRYLVHSFMVLKAFGWKSGAAERNKPGLLSEADQRRPRSPVNSEVFRWKSGAEETINQVSFSAAENETWFTFSRPLRGGCASRARSGWPGRW